VELCALRELMLQWNSLKKKRNKQLLIVSWLYPLTKSTKVGHALRKSLLLLPLFFSVGGIVVHKCGAEAL